MYESSTCLIHFFFFYTICIINMLCAVQNAWADGVLILQINLESSGGTQIWIIAGKISRIIYMLATTVITVIKRSNNLYSEMMFRTVTSHLSDMPLTMVRSND